MDQQGAHKIKQKREKNHGKYCGILILVWERSSYLTTTCESARSWQKKVQYSLVEILLLRQSYGQYRVTNHQLIHCLFNIIFRPKTTTINSLSPAYSARNPRIFRWISLTKRWQCFHVMTASMPTNEKPGRNTFSPIPFVNSSFSLQKARPKCFHSQN